MLETGAHYPLRLDSLPSGWRAGYVGDFAKLIEPGFASGEHNQTGAGIPHLRPMNVDRDGKINLATVKFVAAAKDTRRLAVGDVLFNNTNSPELVGKTAVISQKGDLAFSNHMTRVLFNEEVLPKFAALQLHFLWMRGYFRYNCVKHVNQASISSRTLARAVPFIWAPVIEQERIVAEIEEQFSRLDNAVTNLMRVKSSLKRYRTSVLKFLYSGGSMSEELPSGWQWTTIGEQFRVEVGATPSRKHSGYWGGPIPWVSSGEVQFRRVKRTAETITEEGLRNSSTKLNPAGSVLLGMIGQGRTRGQAAILDIEAANNQNCAAIWVSKTETPPEFVYYWFMSQYEATRRVGSGNNQQALNKSLVQRLPIPWPGSIAEQRRLVAQVEERLQVVEELEAQVRANLARSQHLRRTSLQRAFVQCAEAGL